MSSDHVAANLVIGALRRLPRGAAVLCLHGIRTGEQPGSGGIHVAPAQLEEVLATCTDLGKIVPLPDILARLASGRSASGLVALTFDDACRSVAVEAAPLLRRAGAHATVFAVRDASLSGIPYWWDRLSLCGPRLGDAEWTLLFRTLEWPGDWRRGGDRERLARDVIVLRHQGALPDATDAFLAEIEARHHLAPRYDRALSGDEIAQLGRDGHFSIGVHTCSHRVLSLLPDDAVLDEVQRCHAWLRDLAPDTLPILAIPFGLRDDRTHRLARAGGMSTVLRIAARLATPGNIASGVPRFMVSPGRRGWKLQAALLGAHNWAQRGGVLRGPGDPGLPVTPA